MGFLACKKRSVAQAFACGLVLILMLVALPASANPAEMPKEAANVLKRFVGMWTTDTHIHHAGPPPREITTHGKATCRPSLEGRYFEFRSATIPPGQAELQIMTYDDEAGVYRQWVFSSDGYTHEANGQWDPATSTLRWEGRSGTNSFVIDDHWASPDRLEWTLRRTDSGGKVLQTIDGTVMRTQEP
jgi:Protein of unknown function (DUF1579)